MIQQAGWRVLEGMRESPSAAGGRSRRIRERPVAARTSGWEGDLGAARWRPDLAALAFAGAALAVTGILLYLRKRRQVAEHFKMGEGEAAGEGETAGVFRETETARS